MTGRTGTVRWRIAALLGTGIVVNYLDRSAITVAATTIGEEFDLSLGQIGIILSAFYWSYCAMQLPVGVLLDRIGVMWLNRILTFVWALATALTTVASGFGLILATRLLLGVGEGPVFPSAAKATGYWFPLRERGLATACFDGAARLSNVIALPLLAAIMSLWGWRVGFLLLAGLSVAFGIAWWALYRDPDQHPRLSEAERVLIREGGAQPPGGPPGGVVQGLRHVLRQRKVWAIILGFACYEYAFGLLINWIPSYLQTQMGVPLLQTGVYASIPWVAATIASFAVGGWLVDRLIAAGRDPSRVRKALLTVGFVLGLAVGLAAFAETVITALLCISVALAGLSIAGAIGWSLPSIVAPDGSVGMVGGAMNFLAVFVDIVAIVVTGFVAELTGTFTGPFLLAAAVLLLGLACYLPLLGRIEQVPAPGGDGTEAAAGAPGASGTHTRK